jgi:hypothetical protein
VLTAGALTNKYLDPKSVQQVRVAAAGERHSPAPEVRWYRDRDSTGSRPLYAALQDGLEFNSFKVRPRLASPGMAKQSRLDAPSAIAPHPVQRFVCLGDRPWPAGATLEEAFYDVMGLSGRAPNKVLSAEAKTAGIPLFSEFEVKDDVATWFGTMSPQQDLQFLRYILDEVLASRSDQAATFTDWGRGDFRRATGVVTRIKQLYPELYGMLILDRNHRWVLRFTKMLSDQKPAMVLLGHFHLVGSEGVLAQLAAAGMAVQEI